jgi:multidrug efflux pump subunit AcrB
LTLVLLLGVFVASLGIYPFLGLAFFPRDRCRAVHRERQGSHRNRIEVTNDYVAKIEDLIRHIVAPKDLKMVLSNIGVVNDISSLYTTNAGMYTATIQVALNDGHEVSSFDYMDRVKAQMAAKFPDVRTFFQSGSMQDAILNQGQPAPIDVQVNTRDLG